MKKKLREQDIDYGLTFPSTLRVTHAGKTHFFYTPDDAEKFYRALDSTIDSEITTD